MMKFLRVCGAAGAATVITLIGAGSAFAWHPGDVTLSAECRPDATHLVLKITNKFTQGGDYTLSRTNDSHVFKGHITPKSSVKVTVPYSGKGDMWTVKIPPNVTASLDVTHANLCTTPTPTPSPTKPRPTPTEATPSPSPTSPQLAHTGSDGAVPAVAVGGVLLLGGAGLIAAGRRKANRH